MTVWHCECFVRKTEVSRRYSCLECSRGVYFDPELVKKNALDQTLNMNIINETF